MITILSAGSNSMGQLAQGHEDDSPLFQESAWTPPPDSQVIDIAAGANHTLLLLQTAEGKGELWGSGNGRCGQLGEKYRRVHQTSSTFTLIDVHIQDGWLIKMIAAAWETSYIVLTHEFNGDVLFATGADDFGELGVGEEDIDPNTYVQSPICDTGYLVPFDHLFPNHDSSRIVRISVIKASPHNVGVILTACYSDGRPEEEIVAGWGASRHGQLGNFATSSTFISIPTQLPLTDVAYFSLGMHHSIFLLCNGRVVGLGSNKKLQLNGITALNGVQSVATTWNSTYLVVQSEQEMGWAIFATGSNTRGQLAWQPSEPSYLFHLIEIPIPPELHESELLELACGSEHVVIATRTHIASKDESSTDITEVWGWGWNEHGNLGLGHDVDMYEMTRLWPMVLENDIPSQDEDAKGKGPEVIPEHIPPPIESRKQRVLGVWAGCGTTWIVLEDVV